VREANLKLDGSTHQRRFQKRRKVLAPLLGRKDRVERVHYSLRTSIDQSLRQLWQVFGHRENACLAVKLNGVRRVGRHFDIP
jgi:hypothetical protein